MAGLVQISSIRVIFRLKIVKFLPDIWIFKITLERARRACVGFYRILIEYPSFDRYDYRYSVSRGNRTWKLSFLFSLRRKEKGKIGPLRFVRPATVQRSIYHFDPWFRSRCRESPSLELSSSPINQTVKSSTLLRLSEPAHSHSARSRVISRRTGLEEFSDPIPGAGETTSLYVCVCVRARV